jgi:hypothetical protein
VYFTIIKQGENLMKNQILRLTLLTSKINRQHIQLVLAILALAMLVLGIGAPSDSGGGVIH